jgi:hypothetical protein
MLVTVIVSPKWWVGTGDYGSIGKPDEVVEATTAMQAVLLCKRASKPSDSLDRDPTVSHI